MASCLHNLSEYDASLMPCKDKVKNQRYAIAVADWNSNVTFPLLEGAMQALCENGAEHVDVVHVPGAFELTYAARKLQEANRYDAISVLGCVIQGDTPHFDYVCQSVTQGITLLNANTALPGSGLMKAVPVIFSVLTTLDHQQALDRAGGRLGNKGVEGASTAIKMANL